MFISPLVNGHYYLAERSRRGPKFIWVRLAHDATDSGERVDATEVPRVIRVKAYKLFEKDRLQHARR